MTLYIKKLVKRILGDKLLGAIEYYRYPDSRESWGGPFNGQKVRQRIFLELIEKINFSAIAETGTYRGTTTEFMHNSSGLPVYTVELHPRNFGYVRCRFFLRRSIVPFHDDSRSFLRRLVKNRPFIEKRTFFYLDAHGGEDLPLREEIQFIFENCPQAVVMVDDFKVPGDEAYGFDDYGNGKVLSLEYLKPLADKLQIAAFFPSVRAELESGSKKGCVVLARAPDLIIGLQELNSLVSCRS